MNTNFAPAVEYIVTQFEGGFANNPHDPGGATYQGVTQAVYNAYRLREKFFRQPVNMMSHAERNEIYKFQYWDQLRCDNLVSGLDLSVFDDAINAGPGAAVKALQKALRLKADGHMGLVTVQALQSVNDVENLIQTFNDKRMAFLRNLGTWRYFSVAWQRRVDVVAARSIELCKKGTW